MLNQKLEKDLFNAALLNAVSVVHLPLELPSFGSLLSITFLLRYKGFTDGWQKRLEARQDFPLRNEQAKIEMFIDEANKRGHSRTLHNNECCKKDKWSGGAPICQIS